MNQTTVFFILAGIVVGLLFLWDTTRAELVRAKVELRSLEITRAADNEALSRVQAERDEIARKYETLHRELLEIEDAPSVDYLNTPVPDSVRRLLER